jgi:hypothetical protein
MSTKKRLRIVPSLGRIPPHHVLACTRFNNKTWQEYQDWKEINQPIYEETYKRPLKCIYGVPREISHKKIPPEQSILVIEMNNDENQIMGIGEIQNKTASEPYRSPSRVVSLANAHSSPSRVVSLANAHSTPNSGPDSISAHIACAEPSTEPSPPELRGAPAVGGRTPPRIKYSNIFSDRNYTRYMYIGNTHYATREELERNHTEDAQYINEHLKQIMPQTPQPHHDHDHDETIIQRLERILFKGPRHMKRGSGITKI